MWEIELSASYIHTLHNKYKRRFVSATFFVPAKRPYFSLLENHVKTVTRLYGQRSHSFYLKLYNRF